MADVYAQPSYRSHAGGRPRYPQRIGAKRDQYGRIIPTPRAMVGAGLVTGGGLSAAHDWSAFDEAFQKTRSNAPGGAGPVPLPIVSSMEPVGLNGGQMPVPSIGKPEIAAPAPEVRPVASIANPPPMNNTMPGQGNTATLAPTRTLYRKPMPTALTGPDGTPAQDAANLQQTRDYFAPGGAFETEQERANRIANPPQAIEDVYAAAGTGKNVADKKYGTASSTIAQPVNPADEIKKKYPAIGEEGTPENKAFVDAYRTAGGNWQNAAQMADGIMENMQAPRSEIARSEYLPPAPAPAPVATAPAAPDTFRTSSPTPAIKEIAPQMQPVSPTAAIKEIPQAPAAPRPAMDIAAIKELPTAEPANPPVAVQAGQGAQMITDAFARRADANPAQPGVSPLTEPKAGLNMIARAISGRPVSLPDPNAPAPAPAPNPGGIIQEAPISGAPATDYDRRKEFLSTVPGGLPPAAKPATPAPVAAAPAPVTPAPSGIAPLVRKMVAPTASASTGIAPMIPNSTPVAANGTDEDPYKRRQR